MVWTDFTNSLGVSPGASYGPDAASGNPSGYGGNKRITNRSEIVVGIIVVAVLFMLIAGVIMLRVSGEVVI